MRPVIEEPTFSESYDELLPIFPRLPDVKAGVDWTLSRDPRSGTLLYINPRFRVFKTLPFGDTPAFTVIYRFDDDPDDDGNTPVHLIDIRVNYPSEAE